MKLNQLRNLITVVENGSLRLAAGKLGLTPTALSKSLTLLEDELHVQLVVRHTRGITLTPFGHVFVARARRIVAESRLAMEEMAQLRGERAGTLMLGASPTAAIELVPPALAAFRRKFPDVRVAVRGGLYDAHLEALREGGMDLAIGPVPATVDAAMTHEALFHNDLVVAGRRGHPLAGARTLAELADCEWIVTSANTRGPGAAILDAFAQHGLAPPRRVLHCDITWALPALLSRTDSLCALPRPLFDHQPRAAPLVVVALREALPRYPVCLIHRADSPLLPAAAHFATLIRREAHYYAREHPELRIQG